MAFYGERLPGRPELRGSTCFRYHRHPQKYNTQTLQHMHINRQSPFVFFPKLWLLGSWQFVLSKWYLPVPLPCPSLDVVQCCRSQTELSLRGIRGEKWRSFLQTITLTHGFTIQWIQRHKNRNMHIVTHWNVAANSNRMWTTTRSFLWQRAVGEVNRQSVSSQLYRKKEKDEEKREIERLKYQTKGDK